MAFTTTNLRRAILVALGPLLLLAMGAGIWVDNAANRGVAYDPPAAPIPFADGPQIGVNVFNLHAEPDPAVVTRTLQAAHAMGARYVRMQLPWEDLEIHGKGDFVDRRNDLNGDGTPDPVDAWAKYDRIVSQAVALNLSLVLRLERPPAWARQQALATPEWAEGIGRDGNSTGPPDSYGDYGDFVGAVAGRYKGKVRFFQLWNEPNLKNEWNWQIPSPEQFVQLLRTGTTAARAANPAAVILFPSLSPVDGLDKRAPMTELEYLDRVYRAGGGTAFDIMSAQAYGLGQPPDEHRYVRLRPFDNWVWSRPLDTRADVSRVVLLREVMERNGDAGKAVWIGEFGWNSAPASIPPERRTTWGEPVSEEQKAAYLVGLVERARREWPWMGVMNVWMLRWGGAPPDPNDPTPYFALMNQDFAPLPAYTALQHYLARPAVAGVGFHTWNHAAVQPVVGGWQIRFSGTTLALLGGLEGDIAVTLDGQPATLVRGDLHGRPTLSTDDLADGEHLLEVRTAATPEGFLVARRPPLPWLWPLLIGLPLLLLLPWGAAMISLFSHALDRQLAPDRAPRRWFARAAASVEERIGPRRRALNSWLATTGGERSLTLAMLLALVIFYRGSDQLPITAGGAAIFALLALLNPELALRFVGLAAPLFFIPKGIWDARFGIRDEGIRIPLHEVVLLVAAGTALMRWLPRARLAVLIPRPATLARYAPHILFMVAGTIGVLVAQPGGRGAALREWRWLIVEPLLFYALARHCLTRRNTSFLTTPFLIGGAAVGLIGLLQFGGLNLAPLLGTKVGFSADSLLVEGVRRVNSVYGHPNNLGLYMDRIWPVAAALGLGALLAGEKRRAWPYALVVVLAVGGLLVSFSKGSLLGGALALALAAWLTPGPPWLRRGLWGLLAATGAVVLVAGMLGGVERLNPLGETSSIRLSTWASALHMIRDHPIFGIGLDQFGTLYPSYIDPALASTNELNTAHPHNLLLDIWLRMGLLGLLAFGWLLARLLRTLRPALHPAASSALPLALVVATTAAVTHGLVDSFYFWPDLAFAFWLFLALAEGTIDGDTALTP